MGILVANLPAFGLPESSYFSPLAWGGTAPADIAAWFATFVLVEGKMRGLFALLFGASTLLIVERADAAGLSGAAVHYRRMGVLFVIGCLHLYGLWRGDILAHYALCGAIAFLFVGLPVRWLVAVAVLFAVWDAMQGFGLWAVVQDAQTHPGSGSRGLLAGFARGFGVPPAAEIARELAAYRGSYGDVLAYRWQEAPSPVQLLLFLGPETLATMLLGMAGLKSGFLTGTWPRARYARWAAVTLGLSLPVYIAAAIHTARSGFALADVVLGAMTLAAPLRNIAVVGYAALGVLLLRPGGWLTLRVSAAGLAAFTNYLGTTLVMTTIFYGYGLGLFGQWSRAQLYLLVPFAWMAMLAWSRPWLARHRYGPMEWLWRSLARWRVEPLRTG
ncbi:DUF418 domain-containing protein [Sphingomonas sp.]|uniref:DUF418 domain-containing protein n=1 Tax=Sphingomonas sp. TaxID=28214 RepID=UPI0035BC0B70